MELLNDVLPYVLAAVLFWLGRRYSVPVVQVAEETDTLLGKLVRDAGKLAEAAQQMWNTGQIPETSDGDKDPRFYYALDRIRELWPAVSADLLEAAVEAAVYQAKEWDRLRSEPKLPTTGAELTEVSNPLG